MPTSNQTLLDSAKCVYCGVPKGQLLDVWIALLAAKAGVPANATTLAAAVNCIQCNIPDGLRLSVVASLMCDILGGPCDANTIDSLGGGLAELIPTGYLLPVIVTQTAGWTSASTDPNSLNALATCLDCGLYGLEWSVIIYLLALIAGQSTDPATLLKNATGLQSVPDSVLLAYTAYAAANATFGPPPPVPPLPDFAWWKMDEGAGATTADSSGNGRTATLVGAPLPTWAIWTPTGQNCISMTAASVGQGVTPGSFVGPQHALTMCFWGLPSVINGSQRSYMCLTSGASWYVQFAEFSGSVFADIQNNNQNPSTGRITPAGTIAANQPYFIAMTWNGGTVSTSVKVYVNAVQADNADFQVVGAFTVPNPNALPFYMGNQNNGLAAPFSGLMKDFRIYTTALTQAQLLLIYNAGPQ